MVGGQQYKLNIGVVIQARMNSTRLPEKVLMPIPYPSGPSMLSTIIESVKQSDLINEVIVATTNDSSDDALASYCIDNGIKLFRGEVDNVYDRFYKIVKNYDFDHVVRLTGDNPFIDITLLEKVIGAHISNNNDLTYSSGLPLGMNFAILNGESLGDLEPGKLTKREQEHVTLYFKSHKFKTENLNLNEIQAIENLRLTIDYPEDFAMASILMGELNMFKEGALFSRIVNVYQNKPWIFEVNSSKSQKLFFSSTKDEIFHASNLLNKLELSNAVSILNEWMLDN